jgi:hypothetical protein
MVVEITIPLLSKYHSGKSVPPPKYEILNGILQIIITIYYILNFYHCYLLYMNFEDLIKT